MSKRRAEFDDVDLPVEMLGSPHAESMQDDIADALLELIGDVAKVGVRLQEVPADAWKVIARRLGTLRELVGALPTEPQPSKRMGFEP